MSSRLYAWLLYVYPAAFRREYGEAMQQLFNDQLRAARGVGGHTLLWLKTLRDLAISLPAAHADERSRVTRSNPSKGPVLVWTIVVLLGFTFLLASVVLPSWISRLPSTAEAAPVEYVQMLPRVGGPYLAAVRVAFAVASTVLAIGAFLFALAQRGALTGFATFIAGTAVTIIPLGMLPWLSLPGGPSVAAVWWALGVWPVFALAWIVLRVAGRVATRIDGA